MEIVCIRDRRGVSIAGNRGFFNVGKMVIGVRSVCGLEEELPNVPKTWKLFCGWTQAHVFGYGACFEVYALGFAFDFGIGLSFGFKFGELSLPQMSLVWRSCIAALPLITIQKPLKAFDSFKREIKNKCSREYW